MHKTREIQLHRAYLLHSRPFRDSSLLVDLLSEEHGHVSAIVYVGKSKKSNKKGLLQPFACLQIELKGQGDLKSLSRLEHAEKSINLASQHLYSGFYLNELMVRLLPENIPCPILFNLYQACLTRLSAQQAIEPLLREFELTLLNELGMSLDFDTIVESVIQAEAAKSEQTLASAKSYKVHSQDKYQHQITETDCYNEYNQDVIYQQHHNQTGENTEAWYFIPEQGFVKADTLLNYPRYNQQHLLAIGDGKLTDAKVLLTCKQLMRQVLALYLGNKPLNSRKLFLNRLAK